MLISVKNLSKTNGIKKIVDEVSFSIEENDKVALIGINGTGKSTLLKILAKQETYQGEIIQKKDITISYLPQNPDFNENNTVIEQVYDIIDQSKVNEYEIKAMLNKLGITIHQQLIKQLSGGQQKRVALAITLLKPCDLLILDEPTNHLDKDTKDYVMNYLKNYKGSVFVISHDTDFLNKVTSMTLFLDKRRKTFELYNGNYDRFKELYAQQEKNIQLQVERTQKEEEKLKSFIDKYANSSGKRKKMVQDREKKLEKLLKNKIDVSPALKTAKIDITINRESTTIPLKVQNVSFKYNDYDKKNIINNLSFNLLKGEKFLIVGKNGVGKSTLLKLIVGELKPNSGEIVIGNKTDIGYYAQEHELLDNNKSIIDNFAEVNISQSKLRSVLGRFLFSGDDVFKKVGILSPGERSRVALAKLSLSGANFLILDEPTNHLDPETQTIIADTFKNFPGTMLVVSHNPEFVDNLGIERTLILPDGIISYYDRSLPEYFYKLNTKHSSK